MYFLLVIPTLIAAAHAIADGQDASIKDFPYHVSIETADSKYVCGGVIIGKEWIVTAAHLCAEKPAAELRIRAGTDLRGKNGSLHEVDRVIKHENSFLRREEMPVNDIALMHVSEPFNFDETRSAIPLVDSGEKFPPQTLANVSGFGVVRDEDYLGDLSEKLQKVEIPLIWPHLCVRAYEWHKLELPEGAMCAGFNDVGSENACSGDEGSPLAIEGRLAGIVSWSYNCADAYYPPVYTDIGYFRNWIDQQMANASKSD